MTHFLSTSEAQLKERRRQLRQQRRWRVVQAVWRSLLLAGLASGAVWLMTSPVWVVRDPSQIEVEGNELLADEMIQTLMPIRYPQSILTLRPQAIAQELKTKAPIAEATVTRRLYPAGLTVHVQERYPVAIAYPTAISPESVPLNAEAAEADQVGLLDEAGFWIPVSQYSGLGNGVRLPDLKVFGMREAHYSYWVELYAAIRQSPVKIFEIDWRDPTNLVLLTELGQVHLGSYSAQFPQQLKALDQMRHLSNELDLQHVDYIDLKNLEVPIVQLLEPTSQTDSAP